MSRNFLFLACVLLLVPSLAADEKPDTYLKDGRLTATLEVLQLQGGFAGFTGSYASIAPDGAWTTGQVLPRDKRKETATGKLTVEQMAELAAALGKHDLANLPGGGKPRVNPSITTITFGKVNATLNSAAKGDELAARYEGIIEAVRKVTMAKDEKPK